MTENIAIITDGKEGIDQNIESLLHIIEFIKEQDLDVRGIMNLSPNALRDLHPLYTKEDYQHFRENYDGLREPLSLEKLRHYPLFENLTGDIGNALWEVYQERQQHPNSLHIAIVDGPMVDQFENSYPDHHMLVLLSNLTVISPFVQSQGSLDYHYVGRGFICYGGTSTLDSGKKQMIIPLSVVEGRSLQEKKYFLNELLRHEWIGHAVNGLQDHHDLAPDQCIMVPNRSIDEAIENGKKELYFCDSCQP